MPPIKPALVLLVLFVLIESQLLYAFGRYRRRSYLAILLLTGIGIAVGQAWATAGLPALRMGEAALLPGILFAVALQPLVRRFPALERWRPRPTQIDEHAGER